MIVFLQNAQARRVDWIQPGIETLVFNLKSASLEDSSHGWCPEFQAAVHGADVFLAIDIDESIGDIKNCMEKVPNSVYFGPSQELSSNIRLGGLAIGQLSGAEKAAANLQLWPKAAESFKVISVICCLIRSNENMLPFEIKFELDKQRNSEISEIVVILTLE